VVTELFRCVWPDARITLERHCVTCQRTWHRQLKALGATVQHVDEDVDPDSQRSSTE
jgi:hypothetical protein